MKFDLAQKTAFLLMCRGPVWFFILACAMNCSAESMRPAVHYKPAEGWLGDVHPIYYSGQWAIPYLEVPNEPLRHGLYGVHSKQIVSNDLIHWEQKKIRHEDIEQIGRASCRERV